MNAVCVHSCDDVGCVVLLMAAISCSHTLKENYNFILFKLYFFCLIAIVSERISLEIICMLLDFRSAIL